MQLQDVFELLICDVAIPLFIDGSDRLDDLDQLVVLADSLDDHVEVFQRSELLRMLLNHSMIGAEVTSRVHLI